MDIITQFIENYKKKYSFYETAGRLAADMLEDALRSSGIRAMVISRAKSPARLKAKVMQRNENRDIPYKNMNEIYTDIADLCGVRVSLYFPGDREKADLVISTLFQVDETKKFPGQSKQPSYYKRFSGYWATHYRANMNEDSLNVNQKKYTSVRLEIQVASVLMHAWSEVEHDLVYKPMQGMLSDEELAILDELNGLVLSGEIALERLQAAGNERIQSKNTAFGNQYDLAAYLYDYFSTRYKKVDIDPRMGNVELLQRILARLKLANVKELEPILKATQLVNDRRSVSEQIIDQIICGNEKRYTIYEELRSGNGIADEHLQKAMEYFLKPWISLETVLNRITGAGKTSRIKGNFNVNSLKKMKVLDKESLNKVVNLRNARNCIVHEIDIPETAQLIKMGDEVRGILTLLASSSPAVQGS